MGAYHQIHWVHFSRFSKIFKKVMTRRLPMHSMTPWTHSTVIDFISRHKNEYPYALRGDIEKYYPNVDPFKMIGQVQLAHRDLYALSCVSKSFRETFFPRMHLWAESLPPGHGIPMGSAMSCILATMALVPIWLGIKRKFNVKLLVFADDILVLCKDDHTARLVWDYITGKLLVDLGVRLNAQKTYGGRFANREIDFCGWSFSGGYARIRKYKVDSFKNRFEKFVKSRRRENTRAFINAVNRKIDGFGNYYKHGNVLKQFEDLDCFIRIQVRGWLCRDTRNKAYNNRALEDIGLHSMVLCYRKAHRKKDAKNQPKLRPVEKYYVEKKPAALDFGTINQIAQSLETLVSQQQQIIGLLRKQKKLLEEIFDLDKNSYVR